MSREASKRATKRRKTGNRRDNMDEYVETPGADPAENERSFGGGIGLSFGDGHPMGLQPTFNNSSNYFTEIQFDSSYDNTIAPSYNNEGIATAPTPSWEDSFVDVTQGNRVVNGLTNQPRLGQQAASNAAEGVNDGATAAVETQTSAASSSKPKKQYPCPHCDRVFVDASKRLRHVNIETEKYKCPIDGCQSRKKPKKHSCFGSESDLKRHCDEHHFQQMPGKRRPRYPCPIRDCKRHCGGDVYSQNAFPREVNLINHFDKQHPAERYEDYRIDAQDQQLDPIGEEPNRATDARSRLSVPGASSSTGTFGTTSGLAFENSQPPMSPLSPGSGYDGLMRTQRQTGDSQIDPVLALTASSRRQSASHPSTHVPVLVGRQRLVSEMVSENLLQGTPAAGDITDQLKHLRRRIQTLQQERDDLEFQSQERSTQIEFLESTIIFLSGSVASEGSSSLGVP